MASQWKRVLVLLTVFVTIFFIGWDFTAVNPGDDRIQRPRENVGSSTRLTSYLLVLNKTEDPASRKDFLQKQCRQPLLRLIADLSTYGRRVDSRIVVDTSHGVSYCNVPKVGSSFWFSVFGILAGNGDHSRSPYALWKRYGVNLHNSMKVKYLKQLSTKVRSEWVDKSTLFLFVRDPYARLYSAYMDKLVSPNDYYWAHVGRVITRSIRKNATAISRQCGHDVTFEEFLRFFILSEASSEQRFNSDHHWTPIYKLCGPCHYNYNFIGKTETFKSDTSYIIDKTNLSSAVDFQKNSETSVEADIADQVDKFTNHTLSLGQCVNIAHDVNRLWGTLTAKGYLSNKAVPPVLTQPLTPSNLKQTRKLLTQVALKQHNKLSKGESNRKLRQDAITEAYRRVPIDVINQVRELLLPDFLLFNYNPFPDYIYNNRNR